MQLFTHLLSSYLQGMGDFFSALPRGGSPFLLFFQIVRMAPVIVFWVFEPYISNAVGVVIGFSVKDSWSVVTCICE